VDSVLSRLRPDVEHGVAFALGAREEDSIFGRDPEAERVHQRVEAVAVLEADLAPHGGNSHAVAVAPDAGGDSREDRAVLLDGQRPEAERVHERNRARAHGEDVADDAADSGRRPLEGLDEGRMVVGLDLEDRGEAVADVDHPRVLSRPLQHARPAGRKPSQVDARAFVAAVLGPHHREHPELVLVRLAPELLDDAVVFLPRQVVRLQSFFE
jgi:hypothetical protein